MKKLFNLALFGAIALTGAVGFSSCSSSSDEVIDNPDYDPVTKTVKTAITLSVNPANSSAGTRQSNDIVQATGNFRGMTNIFLVPSNAAIADVTSTANKISLEDFESFDGSSSNYKLYSNKTVSVGVSHFLFLGKAKSNAAASTSIPATKLASGYTTDNYTDAGTTTVGGTTGLIVTPGTILDNTESTSPWVTQTTALATYLGTIANATGWAGNTNPSLNNMHTLFCRTALTAGSANAVLLTLQNLYRKIEGLDATTVANIRSAITAANMAQVKSGTGSTAVLEWQSTCSFKEFPTSLGLPEGAAHYKYNTTNSAFEYTAATSTDNVATTAAINFVYPNELYYLTSTPLKATATKTITWPNSVALWTSETWPSSGTIVWTDAVAGDTKNIALKYNVQYGSALLATQVKCEATTLYDNAITLDTDAPTSNNAINVNANSFKLTGVIVGGQPVSVKWNFLPTSAVDFSKALYDRVNDIDVSSATDYSSANYTLVFDNYKSDTEASDVNVCLEFENNSGTDFYGKDGLILAGQKFYLVGKLTMTGQTNPIPADSGENTDDALDTYFPSRAIRAFIQDYTTTAKFIIKAGTSTATGDAVGSLGKALSTVPDLRTSSQTIGLSVDLSWKAGLTFSDISL